MVSGSGTHGPGPMITRTSPAVRAASSLRTARQTSSKVTMPTPRASNCSATALETIPAPRHGPQFMAMTWVDQTSRSRRAIRLNFTLNPPDRLAEGVRRLASAVRKMAQEA